MCNGPSYAIKEKYGLAMIEDSLRLLKANSKASVQAPGEAGAISFFLGKCSGLLAMAVAFYAE